MRQRHNCNEILRGATSVQKFSDALRSGQRRTDSSITLISTTAFTFRKTNPEKFLHAKFHPNRRSVSDCLQHDSVARVHLRQRILVSSVHLRKEMWPSLKVCTHHPCLLAVFTCRERGSLRASSLPVESYLAGRNTADRKSSFVVATPPQHSAIPLSARNQQQYRSFVEVYLHITLYQIT